MIVMIRLLNTFYVKEKKYTDATNFNIRIWDKN